MFSFPWVENNIPRISVFNNSFKILNFSFFKTDLDVSEYDVEKEKMQKIKLEVKIFLFL